MSPSPLFFLLLTQLYLNRAATAYLVLIPIKAIAMHACGTYLIVLQTSLLKALAQVVKECKNFKVRINAAASLSIPTERSCYGSNKLFFEVWSGLFQALRSSEDASDFAEFKYRENLIEQVCYE